MWLRFVDASIFHIRAKEEAERFPMTFFSRFLLYRSFVKLPSESMTIKAHNPTAGCDWWAPSMYYRQACRQAVVMRLAPLVCSVGGESCFVEVTSGGFVCGELIVTLYVPPSTKREERRIFL